MSPQSAAEMNAEMDTVAEAIADWYAYLIRETRASAPRLTLLLLGIEIGASALAVESIFTALAGLSDEQLTTIGEWIRKTKETR